MYGQYTSSQTPGDKFPHKMYGQYTSSQTPVYEFKTPVYEFTDTGIRVQNTGIRVRRHRYTSSRHRYTSSQTPEVRVHLQFWVTYRSELKNLKTWGSLKIPFKMESGKKKQKKIFESPVSLSL